MEAAPVEEAAAPEPRACCGPLQSACSCGDYACDLEFKITFNHLTHHKRSSDALAPPLTPLSLSL